MSYMKNNQNFLDECLGEIYNIAGIRGRLVRVIDYNTVMLYYNDKHYTISLEPEVIIKTSKRERKEFNRAKYKQPVIAEHQTGYTQEFDGITALAKNFKTSLSYTHTLIDNNEYARKGAYKDFKIYYKNNEGEKI